MEQFFDNTRVLMRLRSSSLAPYLISFAKQLNEQGYSLASGRMQIRVISDFGQWLGRNHVAVQEIISEHAKRHIRFRSRKKLLGKGERAALKRFLDLLRLEGVITEEPVLLPLTPSERLSEEFVLYLKRNGGLPFQQ